LRSAAAASNGSMDLRAEAVAHERAVNASAAGDDRRFQLIVAWLMARFARLPGGFLRSRTERDYPFRYLLVRWRHESDTVGQLPTTKGDR